MEINSLDLKLHKKILEKFIENKISNMDHEVFLLNLNSSNKSFLIFENNQLLGFVPLFFESDKDGNKHAKFYNLSLPGPIFSHDIEIKKYKKLLILMFETIDKKCKEDFVQTVKINFSDLINFDTNSQKFIILLEILLKNSFINKSFLGLRLNISSDIEDLTRKFSKGHKSEIKKQSDKKYFFKYYKDQKINFNEFKQMVSNHVDHIDYIDFLYEIYKKNKILIVYENDLKNFSSIFSLTNNTAEYFLDNNASNNHHSLILNSIKYFKKLNYIKYINMGVIGYLYNNIPLSNKKKNISIFKKGFGGEKYLLSIFEKKYFY